MKLKTMIQDLETTEKHKKFGKKKKDKDNGLEHTSMSNFILNFIFNVAIGRKCNLNLQKNEHPSVWAATGELHLFESEAVVALNQRKWNRAHHYILPSGVTVNILYLFKYLGLEKHTLVEY